MALRDIIVYRDEETLVQTVAARLILRISDLLTAKDRVDVALTGGGDGIEVLRHASDSPLTTAIDFTNVHFWWGDDRFVPENDDDRNAKQAREAWLDSLVKSGDLPAENIHEMPADPRTYEEIANATEAENDKLLAEAARSYQDDIERELGPNGAFDIALFGVGPDGHFASLFPGHPEVYITDPSIKVVGVNHSPKMPPLRVSLSIPFIKQTQFVWVFASSERKSDAIGRALYETDNYHVPSSFAEGTEQTLWMIDRAAAQNLA